jgi:hypothetical protein
MSAEEDNNTPKRLKTVTTHLRNGLCRRLGMPPVVELGQRSKHLVELDIRDMAIDYTGRDIEIKKEKEGD